MNPLTPTRTDRCSVAKGGGSTVAHALVESQSCWANKAILSLLKALPEIGERERAVLSSLLRQTYDAFVVMDVAKPILWTMFYILQVCVLLEIRLSLLCYLTEVY